MLQRKSIFVDFRNTVQKVEKHCMCECPKLRVSPAATTPSLFVQGEQIKAACAHISHINAVPSVYFGVKRTQTLEGKVKTDCNCSVSTTHFFVLQILLFLCFFFLWICNPSLLISQSLLCSNFATVCYGFLFAYLLDSQQQMLVILLKTFKSRVPSGKNYARGSMQILRIHSHCVFFIFTVCMCC